jgi:hypothetical protein
LNLKNIYIILRENPSKWLKLPLVFSELKKMTVKVCTKIISNSNKKRRIKTKYISSKTIFIFHKPGKDAKKKRKMMALKVTAVYNHHREKSAFGYYATNDLSAPDVWSWEMSRFRWNIEGAPQAQRITEIREGVDKISQLFVAQAA